jgi:hypothetical protein
MPAIRSSALRVEAQYLAEDKEIQIVSRTIKEMRSPFRHTGQQARGYSGTAFRWRRSTRRDAWC